MKKNGTLGETGAVYGYYGAVYTAEELKTRMRASRAERGCIAAGDGI